MVRESTTFLSAADRERALLYTTRLVGEGERAEDLVQDAWLRVLKGLPNYQERGRFLPYFFRILTNLCRTEIGRQQRDERRREVLAHAVGHRDAAATDAAERAELLANAKDALLRLPPQQKIAIVLKEWEGLDYREIAELMDITRTNATTLVYRGLKTMRAILDERSEA